MTPELATLGRYLAGEFENEQQAKAEPIWYVHLRLWLRPVSLFTEDSITLFATAGRRRQPRSTLPTQTITPVFG